MLGLNGKGGVERFADYAQWEAWQVESSKSEAAAARSQPASGSRTASPAKKKLSYLEAREYAGIEQRVADAEQLVQAHRAELEDPANAHDAARLESAQAAMDAAQSDLDALYARWAELEAKNG